MKDAFWQYDPELGWANRPGAQGIYHRLACDTLVKFNSRGVRGPEYGYERAPNTYRILFLGDSGMVAHEVEDQYIFVRVVERELRKKGYAVEIINGATRGYGTDQLLIWLRREGIKYKPDLVIYRYTVSDRLENITIHRAFRPYGKSYFYVTEDGSLAQGGVPVPKFPWHEHCTVGKDGTVIRAWPSVFTGAMYIVRDQVLCRSALGTGMLALASELPSVKASIKNARLAKVPYHSYDENRINSYEYRLALALTKEMKRVCDENQIRFIVFPGGRSRFGYQLSKDMGMPNLSMYDAFRDRVADGPRWHVRLDSHMNEYGHRVYGEMLTEMLIERGVIPLDSLPTLSAKMPADPHGGAKPDRLQ